MTKVKFNKDAVSVVSGKDGIIVRKHIAGLEGGRVIDLTKLASGGTTLIAAYEKEVIPCGIPIIGKTSDGVTTYKALPPTDVTTVSGENSTTTYKFDIPEGWSYKGIAGATVLAGMPCPIIVAGVINEVAMLDNIKEMFPSAMETPTALSLSALKSACPHLIFMSDEANDAPSN